MPATAGMRTAAR
jgi:hypothetical protein